MTEHFPAEIVTALNNQITVEFSNSQLYLSAAYYFAEKNFEGIASYLRVESEKERKHGLKIGDFLIKRDRKVTLQPLAEPKNETSWPTAVDVWKGIYEAEKATTASINRILDLALEKKDHATHSFLQPYIDEQVSSEDEVLSLLEKVKAYSAIPGLLYHLDHELKRSEGKPLI
jgi:ferritin